MYHTYTPRRKARGSKSKKQEKESEKRHFENFTYVGDLDSQNPSAASHQPTPEKGAAPSGEHSRSSNRRSGERKSGISSSSSSSTNKSGRGASPASSPKAKGAAIETL